MLKVFIVITRREMTTKNHKRKKSSDNSINSRIACKLAFLQAYIP